MEKLIIFAFVMFCLTEICLAHGNIECEPKDPQSDYLTQLTSNIARIYDIVRDVVDIGLKVAHIFMIWRHRITNQYITQTNFHGNVTFINNPNSERQEESEDEEESDE